MNSLATQVKEDGLAFLNAYGREAEVKAYAPGRVNLIGDHTDYNQGFVLPVAIDMGTTVFAARRTDNNINIVASDIEGARNSFQLNHITFDDDASWSNYIRGTVLCVLQALKLLPDKLGSMTGGADLLISGNIPQGAGLSSSASLEIAVIKALSALYGLNIDGLKAAKLGQQAENEFVGCNCGIMDQLISALGQASCAMLLDCKTLNYRHVSVPDELAMVVINSNVKRELVESEYNLRRQQCDQAAAFFDRSSLREVTPEMLLAAEGVLEPILYRRARHVITENRRTEQMCTALEQGDISYLSQLMHQSHASLRDDFEVSTTEIDLLVAALAKKLGSEGGVRMTGGGFGGCVIALVPVKHVATVEDTVKAQYQMITGLNADFYLCTAQSGAFSL